MEGGNVANDPHEEFTGRNILYQANEVEDTALHFESPSKKSRRLSTAARTLLAARGKRPRPHLDDKVLTSWNGLMISALAKGGAVLDESRYAEAARRAAEFVIARMYNAGDRNAAAAVSRRRRGDSRYPGRLRVLRPGTAGSVRSAFELRHLELAIAFTEKQRELFEDPSAAAFFSSGAGDAIW